MYRIGVGGNPFRVDPTNFRAMAMSRDATVRMNVLVQMTMIIFMMTVWAMMVLR